MTLLEIAKTKQNEVLFKRTLKEMDTQERLKNIFNKIKDRQDEYFQTYKELLEVKENVSRDSIKAVDELIEKSRTFSIPIGEVLDTRTYVKMQVTQEDIENNHFTLSFVTNMDFNIFIENQEIDINRHIKNQIKELENIKIGKIEDIDASIEEEMQKTETIQKELINKIEKQEIKII